MTPRVSKKFIELDTCPRLPATISVAVSGFQKLHKSGGAQHEREGSSLWIGVGREATGWVAAVAF